MHIKFMAHGTGSGAGAARYLTGEKDHTGKVRAEVAVLRGNPELVGQVADSLEFQHRYTSGVIAWAPEDAPTLEEINEVLDDYERAAFAGLEPDRYAFAAVLHREDNGGVHVHVFNARVDLATGKSLNIAPPGWEKTFDPLRDHYNHRHGWARPDDPARARTHQPGVKALMDAASLRAGLAVEPDAKALISDYLEQRITAGHIADRAGILAALRDAGLEINREGKDYVSVKDPDTNEKYRLKGGIYDQHWTVGRTLEISDRARSESHRRPDPSRADSARQRLEEAIQRRADYNQNRYPVREQDALTVDQGRAITDERTSRATAPAIADADTLARSGDRRRLPADDRADMALPADRVVHRQDRDMDARRGEASDGHHQPGLDDLPRPAANPAPLQNHYEELTNDRDRNAVAQFLEDIERRIRSAGEALNRAVDRCKQALGHHDRQLSHLTAADRELVAATGRLEQGTRKMIHNRDDELERIKRDVNLVEYAEACGYQIDKKESSRNSTVMRSGDDKIIVATGTDGHGVYFSVRDQGDNGSVVDFVQRRQGLNLGQVRKELRPWAGITATGKPPASIKRRKAEAERPPRPVVIERDRAAVIARAHQLDDYSGDYLQEVRGLTDETIDRFRDKIRQDERGNVCFLHSDRDGITGWEVKNRGFTGFAAGGSKSAFAMATGSLVERVVITESAIDAMSYHQKHGKPGDYYIAMGGEMSPEQRALLENIVKKAPHTVIATDNDEKGHQFAAEIKQWQPAAERQVPATGKDWNDEIQADMAAQLQRSWGMSYGR